jgi:regulator of cell morphogenesis and NO signaling
MFEQEANMKSILDKTVREIATENPASTKVFEALGIDYCCGGNRSLQQACERASLAPEHVIEMLSQAGARTQPESDSERNWAAASAPELIAHIVNVHHAYTRSEIPRITALLDKVSARHGAAHPEVLEVRPLVAALAGELMAHMLKEEQILFPFIEQLDGAEQRPGIPAPCFGSIAYPIARMLADHNDAGALLARIRELTDGYAPPADACPTFRALYKALDEFERDLHLHIHLENNILFPAAQRLEEQASATRG